MEGLLILSDEGIAVELLGKHKPGEETLNTGELRSLLQRNRPRYIRIHQIMRKLTQDPALQADLTMGVIYGLRGQSGLWDVQVVYKELDQARALIATLPEGTARKSLERRTMYHLGLVQREVYAENHFLKAAETHERAAELAESKAKESVERATAAVERLHHAVEISDLQLAEENFQILRDLESVLAGESDQEAQKWLHADIPAHRMYVGWLLEHRYDEQDADHEALHSLPDEHKPVYSVWAELSDLITDLDKKGDSWEALLLADKIVKRQSHPTHDCLALYGAAEAFDYLSRQGFAFETYKHIVHYPSHGAHFVRAAAKYKMDH